MSTWVGWCDDGVTVVCDEETCLDGHGNWWQEVVAGREHLTPVDLQLAVDAHRRSHGEDVPEREVVHGYTVPDGPKALRETLAVCQSFLGPWDPLDIQGHRARLQRLVDECERKRPTGPDGGHGDRHTPECGCEDAS